jgi:hypothetical protein
MPRPDLYIHSYLQNSLNNTATNYTTLKILNVSSWLIYIKTTNDNHFWRNIKISFWNWNFADGLANSVNIIFLFSRNRYNWSIFTTSVFHKLFNLFIILFRSLSVFKNNVNLILKNDHMI